MPFLYGFFVATLISLALIPPMMRLAPRFGMIDMPSTRKVHTVPIPRVGGIGIVMGTIISIILWLPLDKEIVYYLFGSLVLLGFGLWDDHREMGHYIKLLGQFIAAISVVYGGEVCITHFPYLGIEPISPAIGKPFTVFAIVGMINAINHSDGLDGLAGGISLMSLSCLAYLAFIAGGSEIVIIALAAIGGIIGFLRYNTYPARVFMGDGGSQFLGFTLGFLAVVLTQQSNRALSAALPLLILGLPIADILAVLAQRIYHGMNWFRATKNHIHHRLLTLGLNHNKSVVIIYSIQAIFTVSAVFTQYSSDAFITFLYLTICATIFVFLTVAERSEWHFHPNEKKVTPNLTILSISKDKLLVKLPLQAIQMAIPLYFLSTPMMVTSVPHDFGVSSIVLAAVLVLHIVYGHLNTQGIAMIRLTTYITAAFVVYLGTLYPPSWISPPVDFIFFALLAIAVGLVIRYARTNEFRTTPTDYLVVFVVIIIALLSGMQPDLSQLGFVVVKSVIVLYGCELIIERLAHHRNAFCLSVLTTLVLLGLRGILLSG